MRPAKIFLVLLTIHYTYFRNTFSFFFRHPLRRPMFFDTFIRMLRCSISYYILAFGLLHASPFYLPVCRWKTWYYHRLMLIYSTKNLPANYIRGSKQPSRKLLSRHISAEYDKKKNKRLPLYFSGHNCRSLIASIPTMFFFIRKPVHRLIRNSYKFHIKVINNVWAFVIRLALLNKSKSSTIQEMLLRRR